MRNSPYKFFQRYKAWCYLLPALLILGVFQIYPIIKSFFMGFYTEFDYINGIVYQWGTDNFIKVLEDPDFLLAIKNTCKLVIFAAPLSIGISLLFAVLLNSNILLRKFFQSIYFLPFVTSMVAVSIVWAWMLNKDFGLVNAVLKVFGIFFNGSRNSIQYIDGIFVDDHCTYVDHIFLYSKIYHSRSWKNGSKGIINEVYS